MALGMCRLGLVLKNNLIDTEVNEGSASMHHLLRECKTNRAIKVDSVHLVNQYLFYRSFQCCLIIFAVGIILNVTLYTFFSFFSNFLLPLSVSE